jgi:hypothetical protein
MASKSRKKRTRGKKRINNTTRTVVQKSENVNVSYQENMSEQVTTTRSLDGNKITPLRDSYIIYELKRIGILAGIVLIILITLALVIT